MSGCWPGVSDIRRPHLSQKCHDSRGFLRRIWRLRTNRVFSVQQIDFHRSHEPYHSMESGITSFNRLKRTLRRASMKADASRITKHLAAYVKLTEAAVQMRTNRSWASKNRLNSAGMKDRGERYLESRIAEQWSASNQKDFLPGVCRYVAAYQVALMDRRKADEWGKVDLLGVGFEQEPVVLELKKAKSNDSPLAALIEGLGYAIALRKNWDYYRTQLQPQRDAAWHAVTKTTDVPVVVIAPAQYWKRVRKSQKCLVASEELASLAAALATFHHPVYFASIEVSADIQPGEPLVWTVANRKDVYHPIDR